MDTLLHRISEIARLEGISIGALERQIGASKGVLSRAIQNNTDIQAKWLTRIVENYPSYSASWLLSGTGEITGGQVHDFSKEEKLRIIFWLIHNFDILFCLLIEEALCP